MLLVIRRNPAAAVALREFSPRMKSFRLLMLIVGLNMVFELEEQKLGRIMTYRSDFECILTDDPCSLFVADYELRGVSMVHVV